MKGYMNTDATYRTRRIRVQGAVYGFIRKSGSEERKTDQRSEQRVHRRESRFRGAIIGFGLKSQNFPVFLMGLNTIIMKIRLSLRLIPNKGFHWASTSKMYIIHISRTEGLATNCITEKIRISSIQDNL